MFTGAIFGGLSGFAFGAVDAYYGADFGLGRVFVNGFVGGWASDMAGGDFWQGFGMSLGNSLLMFANYNRNFFNKKAPESFEDAINKRWYHEKQDILHEFHHDNVRKVTGPNWGFSEHVYEQDGTTIIIDDSDKGTFNYGGSQGILKFTTHPLFDVVPSLLWGNTPNDPTTVLDRFYKGIN